MSGQAAGQAIGDEQYFRGDSNTDGSIRLLTVGDVNGDGLLDAKLQWRVSGAWIDIATVNSIPASAVVRADGLTAQQAFDAIGTGGSTVTAAGITDATAAGRGLITAADAAAQRALLSLLDAAQHAASDFAAAVHGHAQSDITGLITALSGKVATGSVGVAGGVASLDGSGKVPTAQVPFTSSNYKGTWNASTNTPTLAQGTGTNGDWYKVAVSGTRDLGEGTTTFGVGGIVAYNSSNGHWEYSGSADAVGSVFGRTGAIVGASGDYNAGQTTNTPAGGITTTTVQAALNELDTKKAPLASPTLTGTVTIPTPTAADNSTKAASTAYVQGEIGTSGVLTDISGNTSVVHRWTGSVIRAAIVALAPGANGAGNTGEANGAVAVAMTTTEAQIGSCSITPSSSTAKILILATPTFTKDATATARTYTARVRRGTLNTDTQVGRDVQVNSAISGQVMTPGTIAYVDSPGTTSATTYSIRGVVSVAGGTATSFMIEAIELPVPGSSGINPSGTSVPAAADADQVAFTPDTGTTWYRRLVRSMAAKWLGGVTGEISLAFSSLFGNAPTIFMFGAVGDDSNDDTAAFKNAISYIAKQSTATPAGGIAINLRRGRFKLTENGVLSWRPSQSLWTPIRWFGQGYHSTIIHLSVTTTEAWLYDSSTAGANGVGGASYTYSSFQDIGFEGSGAQEQFASGFKIFSNSGATPTQVEQGFRWLNCRLLNLNRAWWFTGSTNASEMSIVMCRVYDINAAVVTMDNTQSCNINFETTHFEVIRNDIIKFAAGGGGFINISKSSIIWGNLPAGGTAGSAPGYLVNIPSATEAALMSGIITFNQVRCEMKQDAMCVFRGGTSGAMVRVHFKDVDFTPGEFSTTRTAWVDVDSFAHLIYERCRFSANVRFTVRHGSGTTFGNESQPSLGFTDCELPNGFSQFFTFTTNYGRAWSRNSRSYGNTAQTIYRFQDFDLPGAGAYTSAIGLQVPIKTATIKDAGRSWCNGNAGAISSAFNFVIELPINCRQEHYRLFKKATSGTSTYVLSLGAEDKSVTYCSTPAAGQTGQDLWIDTYNQQSGNGTTVGAINTSNGVWNPRSYIIGAAQNSWRVGIWANPSVALAMSAQSGEFCEVHYR